MPLDYILEITYPAGRRELDDAVESLLFVTNSLGSTIDDRDGRTVVACYFSKPEDRDGARAMLPVSSDVTIDAIDREHVDWLELYQQSLEPIEIGRRFVVAPDAALIPQGSRIPIIVPQEQAFGTGSHATTALCVEMLEGAGVESQRCLDIGTGSGILAIAMAKLGGSRIVAFDNDLDTLGALGRNLQRNGLHRARVMPYIGDLPALSENARFGVITMNILPHVIIEHLARVAAHLSPHGTLILSGIVVDRRDEVVGEATKRKLTLEDEASRGEWWCGLFRS